MYNLVSFLRTKLWANFSISTLKIRKARLINQAVEILRKGGVIVYPTDSGYALGCMIGDKHAMDRIVAIRKLPEGHNFTLVCSDLSELSTYATVSNSAYRLIKNNTPGVTPLF